MRLAYKLVLAMLFVAAAPIGLAGYQALGLSRSEIEGRIHEVLSKSSVAEAEIVGRDVHEIERSLHLLASALTIDPGSLTGLSDDLARVYLLNDRFNAAALFDQAGRQVGPVIVDDAHDSFSFEYQNHEDMTQQELDAFLGVVLATTSRTTGCALERVYTAARRGTALAVCSATVTDTAGGSLRLVVEVSLQSLQKRFEHFRVGREGFAFVVDAAGRLVFHRDQKRALARASMAETDFLARRLGTSSPSVGACQDPARGALIGAFAPVPDTSWAVVVAQPEAEALAPVRRLGLRLGTWLVAGLILAVLLGWLLSRRIVRPVQELVRGALAIASGDLKTTIHVRSRDEIGRLGQTFNHMGSELASQRQQIDAQTEEIRRWNLELQNRVEARTRELKEAQDQLLQAQKMAAVGELGAGMAHEINNPLMGVIGCAQLLLMRHRAGDPDHELLADIEREGKRIKDIITSLLDYSQGGGLGMARTDVATLVNDLAASESERLAHEGIALRVELLERLPMIMGRADELLECLRELLINAQHAMPDGGQITIRGSGVEGQVVQIEVVDNGQGIDPEVHERIFEPFFTSKQNWDGKGLGLAKVFQIVQRHMGRISVDSQPGQGARFSLTFPALRSGTHLR